MAGSINKVILVGNLGKDPEIRRTQDGRPIANLRVATSESWKDKSSGEKRERTEWHSVVIFSEGLCRVVEQFLKKGSKVYIEGQLQTRKWQGQDGQDRTPPRWCCRTSTASWCSLIAPVAAQAQARSQHAGGRLLLQRRRQRLVWVEVADQVAARVAATATGAARSPPAPSRRRSTTRFRSKAGFPWQTNASEPFSDAVVCSLCEAARVISVTSMATPCPSVHWVPGFRRDECVREYALSAGCKSMPCEVTTHVAEGNCVAARRGGEQPEANG